MSLILAAAATRTANQRAFVKQYETQAARPGPDGHEALSMALGFTLLVSGCQIGRTG